MYFQNKSVHRKSMRALTVNITIVGYSRIPVFISIYMCTSNNYRKVTHTRTNNDVKYVSLHNVITKQEHS